MGNKSVQFCNQCVFLIFILHRTDSDAHTFCPNRKPFIDVLNARFAEYAGFEYRGAEPGYACLRFFATQVADAMASGDNKWVVEQVMDIEAPEMVRLVAKLIEQTVAAGPPVPPRAQPG